MIKKSCKHLSTLATVMFIMVPAVVCAWPVPDTGQTQSYTDTFGEDSDYTINPHSYTDLGNGVVQDNVTGLEWQQATAPGTYTWQQAIDYCNDLTLGGHDAWRLPTIKELSTLLDSSIPYPGPSINTTYFPDTVGASFFYWSSSTNALYTNDAWCVLFGNGFGYYDKSNGYYVRAVRGGQFNNSFVDNSDGTISDTSTGLMWQKATAPGIGSGSYPDRYMWHQALDYCENLTLAGHSDWRLPNRNELQSIVDYNRYYPTIDTTFFPGTVAFYYWSSTTAIAYTDTGFAWLVFFGPGDVGYSYKSNFYYVRAVRSGQDVPVTTTTVSVTTTTTIPNGTTTTISNGTTTTTISDTSTTTTTTPKPCVAEAIYGENSEKTELLKNYRDNVLSKTHDGQEIIKIYYKFSPTVTKLLVHRPLLMNKAKTFLDRMLPRIRKEVEESNKQP